MLQLSIDEVLSGIHWDVRRRTRTVVVCLGYEDGIRIVYAF